MADTFYFSHDYNTRSDKKVKRLIAKHGFIGYGIFWAIIEDLYNNDNRLDYDLDLLAYDLRVDQELLKSIINDFGFFIVKDGFFFSKSIEKRIKKRIDRSEKARENANKRWGNNELEEEEEEEENATAMQPQCENNATAMPVENFEMQNDAILKDIILKDIKVNNSSSNIPEKTGFVLKVRKGKSKKPSDFEIDIGLLERFKKRFPEVTDDLIKRELTTMELWTEEKPVSRLPTEKGIPRFITQWILKANSNKNNGISKNGSNPNAIEDYRANREKFINGE